MRFSTRGEYGVRVMVTLARAAGEGPLSLSAIARREKLPHAYLEHLIGDLRAAGLVVSQRGQSGGYRLSRDAEQISMAEVMRALEGPILQMPCAGQADAETCDRPAPCSVHEVFQRVYESVAGTLSATTLAEALVTAGGPPYPPATRLRIRRSRTRAPAAGGSPRRRREPAEAGVAAPTPGGAA